MADEQSKDSEIEAKISDMSSTAGDLPASFEILASLIRSGQVPLAVYESWLKNPAFRRFYLKNYER
jgi:hypothetical protein